MLIIVTACDDKNFSMCVVYMYDITHSHVSNKTKRNKLHRM